jgi:hypothetical protein
LRADRFSVRAGFANTCALRAPTPSSLYGYTPSVQTGRGFQVNRTQGEEEADVRETCFEMQKTVYPMIVVYARMASSSVCKRRSARTDFPSVQAFANSSP